MSSLDLECSHVICGSSDSLNDNRPINRQVTRLAGRFSCLDRFSLELIRATSHDCNFPQQSHLNHTVTAPSH
jgi:hypothetical protein